MDANDEKVFSDIEQCGWHVVMVGEHDRGPGFAYSVGLYKSFGQPEVIVLGLPLKTMHLMINAIGDLVRDGLLLEPGLTSDGVLESHDVRFEEVAKRHYRNFGYAMWLYKGDQFPALQCFWPDSEGRFPDSADAPDWIIKLQPALQK